MIYEIMMPQNSSNPLWLKSKVGMLNFVFIKQKQRFFGVQRNTLHQEPIMKKLYLKMIVFFLMQSVYMEDKLSLRLESCRLWIIHQKQYFKWQSIASSKQRMLLLCQLRKVRCDMGNFLHTAGCDSFPTSSSLTEVQFLHSLASTLHLRFHLPFYPLYSAPLQSSYRVDEKLL